jgi:hypothetical protein
VIRFSRDTCNNRSIPGQWFGLHNPYAGFNQLYEYGDMFPQQSQYGWWADGAMFGPEAGPATPAAISDLILRLEQHFVGPAIMPMAGAIPHLQLPLDKRDQYLQRPRNLSIFLGRHCLCHLLPLSFGIPLTTPALGHKRTLLQTRNCDVLDGHVIVGSMAK